MRVVESKLAADGGVDAIGADDEVRCCGGGVGKFEADFVSNILTRVI